MIERIQFAICMAWQYRKALKKYCQDPLLQRQSVLEIDPHKIKSQGIEVMAIDFDGVLAAYGEVQLSQDIAQWLNSCMAIFGNKKVFILTNKPTPEREAYFFQQFSGLALISPKRKKPYTDGILHIVDLTKVSPEHLLLIDDRLLTGILAAIMANTAALYITKPMISLFKRPIRELFFMALRLLERFGFKFMGD